MPAALAALDDIYAYTLEQFGTDQSDRYVGGLFSACESVADAPIRKIPKAFQVEGNFRVYQEHFIYWRLAKSEDVIVVAILHQSQNLPLRLVEAEEQNG